MGAIERSGYVFEPEYSVINQDGAIHVYHKGEFIEEIKFSFDGEGPELDQIEKLIDEYCDTHEL
ncbi:YbxH family protein [Mesobacillus selenatarsenatis]|uniref:YbxH protein n=1 Tax=Mesobacillus selenatarsenatis (strain DSM 18680 / JCM 14380 / FERM P-15431 / SF-1) TaxID=1321606 RepID=A0A0A8X5J6_MESS1|nr:YbxH family protein [Mesobacillus selenatarsenatis]GAM13381.1 unknown [Mesobacillus selenatarsenatis SF-1]